jgi:hypothetical protein
LPTPGEIEQLQRKRWHVHCKPPFGGHEQVLRYLGRYTNRHLISLDERGLTFRTKHGKVATLSAVAFLQRFVEHVLPARFVKIRAYGLLAASNVSTGFAQARSALTTPSPTTADEPSAAKDSSADHIGAFRALVELTGTDLAVCPACGARAMLPSAREPPAEAA